MPRGVGDDGALALFHTLQAAMTLQRQAAFIAGISEAPILAYYRGSHAHRPRYARRRVPRLMRFRRASCRSASISR